MSLHRKIFFLLLALLPTQLGYHFWPPWAIVLGRRIDYLSPTVYLTDILVVLVLFFWFIEKPHIRFSRIRIPAILFIAVNIWIATRVPVALYAWAKFVEFALLGFYIFRSRVTVSFVVFPLAIGVLYSSMIAITQYLLQHAIGGPLWFLGERIFYLDTPGIARITVCNPLSFSCVMKLRAYATFPHPNVLGGYIATILPLLINECTNKQINEFLKKIYATVIVLGLIALVLTFSRSAWVVAGFGIGNTIKKIPRFLLLLLFIGLLIAFFPQAADESLTQRVALGRAALDMWKSAPLLGVGLGNFVPSLPAAGMYLLQPVHTIYFLLLSEIGMIGVVGVIGVIWGRVKPNAPLIALLLLGLVDHYPLTLQQGQLLFTITLALALKK